MAWLSFSNKINTLNTEVWLPTLSVAWLDVDFCIPLAASILSDGELYRRACTGLFPK